MAAASQYLKLKPNEIALFDRLFSLVEDPNTGAATGAQVSGLFLTSGLPRPTLATIWNIASAGKGGKLDKDGFFIGCRLISIAQQNLPVTQESLIVHRDLPLPIFHGSAQQFYPREQHSSFPSHANAQSQNQNPPNLNTMAGLGPGTSQIMPTVASMPQMMAASQSQLSIMPGQNHPLPQSTMKPASQMVSTAQQTRVLPPGPSTVSVPSSLPPSDFSQGVTNGASDPSRITQLSTLSSATNSRRSSVQTDSIWEISPEKRETYLKYFDQADADKDGFVNGKEAKTFFTMSKLSSTILRDIWLLSDIDQDNRLNKEEFTIAMHLTMAVRMSTVPLPAQLPEPLMQYYKRQTQQFQSLVNITPMATGLVQSTSPATTMIAQPSANLNVASSMATQPFNAAVATAVIPSAAALQSAHVDRSAEKTEYSRQISSMKAQIEEQKIAIQGYQSRVPNYEEELHNLRSEAKAAEETLERLTSERKQHQAVFEKIRNDIADAKADLDAVNSKIAEERSNISKYQDKIAQGTLQLEELRQERDKLQKSVDDLKHQIQDKELAVVCLEQEMEDVRKQIDHINEVSSYQLQILSKTSNDHEEREKQLAELFASKAQLDRLKVSSSTVVGTSSSSAPISPMKNANTSELGSAWAAQPLNATATAARNFSHSLIQEEFTFPEFSDDDFHNSPLKSAPGSVAPICIVDTGKGANLSEQPVAALPKPDSLGFSSELESHQTFPIDAGPINFSWESQTNDPVNNVSAKAFEMNPFEAEDWNSPVKTLSVSSSESGKLQSVSSQTLNTESIAWPTSEFGVPSGSGIGDWAQF